MSVYKDEEPVLWTGRSLSSCSTTVKYLTGKTPGYKVHDPVTPRSISDHRFLVIVEDVVSAWAISEKLGLAAYPLMGNSLTREHLAHLHLWLVCQGVGRVVVWLDNDGAHVNAQARKIAKNFKGTGIDAPIYRELADPKKALATMNFAEHKELKRCLSTI